MNDVPSIKSDIEQLKAIAGNINEKSVSISLNELSEKLIYNQFYLVIVGLFKRGKSSIINSLIGRELAPVAVTPLTSVITFFQYGSVTAAEVYFKNGNHVPIDLHDIFLYISEENNPKNYRNVEYVKINTKADVLENIILVDTPGLGSLFSHNTNTTIEFLPRIDAALFVLSADVPISKADEEILRKIKDSIPNVLFVLNKSDLLNSKELEEMVRYNLKMLKEIFKNENNEIELIPVSTREFFRDHKQNGSNDPGNIRLLRNKINQNIIGSRDEILMSRSIKLLLSLSDQIKTFLTVKSDTLQLPVHELEKKRESMQNSIDYLASGKEDFDAVVKSRIQQLIAKVTEQTEKKRKDLSQYYYHLLIENQVQTWAELKKSDADNYSSELTNNIIKEFDELKTSLEQTVKEEFSNILLQYSTLSQSFLFEIIKQMKEILGINIEGIISSFDLDVYTSFYFKTDTKYAIPSIRKNIFFKILPDTLVRSMVLKQIYTNCLELINPNAGRIRGDIDYKISESYRKFKYHFDQKLYDLLQSLKNMIDESIRTKSSIHENIEATLERLRFEQGTIDNIKKHYSLPDNKLEVDKAQTSK
jgi:small GTP-binding protein